jgi:hypothetical protein
MFMKPNTFKKLSMGALVAIMLLVGLGTTADAQGRVIRRPRRVIFYRHYDPFWDYRPSYRVVDPIGSQREQGYSDGLSEGKDDAKEGRAADPQETKKFNKSKSLAYREAFVKGYLDGYRKKMDKGD